MSAGPLYLGVDGGGTKTEFVCIDADGVEVARARTGPTYHLGIGVEGAVRELAQGVREIAASLSVAGGDIAYAFFGLPAYGEDRDADPQLNAACGALLGHARYACGNDMVCGWAGSLACEDGINVVAGTGSIGYGEYGGSTARAGGWGELFSDEGSAYWIAIEGLATFSRMSDGRLPPGPLHAAFREALALTADIDACQRVMGPPGMSRDQIAALAPLVTVADAQGDHAARLILDRAADHLAGIALALRRALGFPGDATVPLSWSGSILTEVEPVRARFIALLQKAGPFAFTAPRHTPAYGAALYARRLADQAR
jgi:N-acetylglucosamine kinase-like BadF-type ATPase